MPEILAIVDFNRTLYNPDTGGLTEGALELLQSLKNCGIVMVLVSKIGDGREAMLEELGINDFFVEVFFVSEKTEALFQEIIARYQPTRAYVVGDHLHQEIRAGNAAGAITIHFRQGRFADLLPEGEFDAPRAVITRLVDALEYIM